MTMCPIQVILLFNQLSYPVSSKILKNVIENVSLSRKFQIFLPITRISKNSKVNPPYYLKIIYFSTFYLSLCIILFYRYDHKHFEFSSRI